VLYGGEADVALQPGGDAGGEVGRVAGGQEQAGIVAAEVRDGTFELVYTSCIWRA
jgi:hypothetical protein